MKDDGVPVFHAAKTAEEFLKNPWKYVNQTFDEPNTWVAKKNARFNRNSNWKTFGEPNVTDSKEIDEIIRNIDDEFDFIMITEYLLESLVLLKYDLELELRDISFLSKMVADHDRTITDSIEKNVKKER